MGRDVKIYVRMTTVVRVLKSGPVFDVDTKRIRILYVLCHLNNHGSKLKMYLELINNLYIFPHFIDTKNNTNHMLTMYYLSINI